MDDLAAELQEIEVIARKSDPLPEKAASKPAEGATVEMAVRKHDEAKDSGKELESKAEEKKLEEVVSKSEPKPEEKKAEQSAPPATEAPAVPSK